MPLTPEDVSNKRFTPVRLREGYDMGEVDQFLDEVEAELGRLLKENEDLHERVRVASENPSYAAPAPVVAEPSPELGQLRGENDELRQRLAAAQRDAAEARAAAQSAAQTAAQSAAAAPAVPSYVEPTPPPAPVAPSYDAPQEIRVTNVAEASSAAARLLEMATNNADQMVAQAKSEADQILGSARIQAERVESDAKANTDRLEAEARTRAQMLDSETSDRRQQMFGDLEREKGRLATEIENLRSFEREYRSRLKSYFTQQLQSLDADDSSSSPVAGVPSYEPAGEPKRLRSLLGDEEY